MRERHVRAGGKDGVAYASAGADAGGDGGVRAGAALGRAGGGDQAGDVVWFAPGEKHWHGAGTQTAMTHIAIQERLDGKAVEWLEHVSDEA